VAPEWDAPPSPSPDLLLVDPGRAFGTGTHETTSFCLAALEHLAERRSLGRTLDLGAGTALLAIAASRLGAQAFAGTGDADAARRLLVIARSASTRNVQQRLFFGPYVIRAMARLGDPHVVALGRALVEEADGLSPMLDLFARVNPVLRTTCVRTVGG